MAAKSSWGGKRPNSGPPRRRLSLGRETAKSLQLLTKHRRAVLGNPTMSEEAVVAALVEAAWREVDQAYQAAETAQEPYIV